MMREGLIHLLQSLPPKEQLLSQFPNFEEWWDNSHRWWFCLDFHLNIYYPALVTFVFSIVSRAWLMKLLTPWRQTLFTRGTIWESWWLEWTVLQILIMAQPFNPSEKWRDQIKVAERFMELNWDTTFVTFCKLHQWVVQWAVINYIWNICRKHFVSQIVYFSVKLQYTVPPDQNNMFSPPPQPKIPLKMPVLSQNAIFVTEKVNFYPNNWKFTFLPNRAATKN